MSTAHALMQQLSRETVRLLSSSQVITSVHSVVKELVENSLDAEATIIEIKLENYGCDLIEVRDNGVGVSKKNIPYLAQAHCTSKLSRFDDLTSLTTYGFRGEALSSIAAVASLVVTTSTGDDDVAMTYTMDHSGQVVASKPSHFGRGTTISITKLFRNVPVRKQYLKNGKWCREELRKVEELMLAFGIAHPKVRFTLKHNQNVIWQKIQTSDQRTNIALLLGTAAMQQLMSIAFQSFDPMLKLYGWVPKPRGDVTQLSRATGDRVFLLVNKRPVVVKPVIQVIKQKFAEAFPSQSGRYPVAVVCVDVLPSELDVNLEPNKTSVLFHNMDFVTETLSRVLTDVYFPKPEAVVTEEDQPNPLAPVTKRKQGKSVSSNRDQRTNKFTRTPSPEASCPSRTDNWGNIGGEHSQTPGAPRTPKACGPSRKEVTNTFTNGATRCSDEALVSDRSICTALEPKSYELLDISDLEEDIESFSHFSDEEEGTTDDVGGVKEKDEGRAMGQPSLKQATLAEWSRGEALRDSTERPVEPVKLLKPSCGTPSAMKTPTSKVVYKGPPPVYDMINSRPVKRKPSSHAEQADGANASKRRKEAPQAPPGATLLDQWRLRKKEGTKDASHVAGLEVPTQNVVFDLSGIEQRNEAIDGSRPAVVLADRVHVIGYCDPPGYWLVAVSEKIVCFDAARYKSTHPSWQSVGDSEVPVLDRKEVADLLAAATADDIDCIATNSNSFHTLCTLTAGE